MGLAGNNLRKLLAFQQAVEQRQAAAVLVPAPYYIRSSQQGLLVNELREPMQPSSEGVQERLQRVLGALAG